MNHLLTAQPSQLVNVQATTVGKPHSRLKSELKRQRIESGESLKQTELQIYLSESIVDDKDDFDFD